VVHEKVSVTDGRRALPGTRHKLVAVAQTGVPTQVRHFIAAEIESVGQLEVLLLLRGASDKTWTGEEVARALVMRPASATSWLDQIAGSGLITANAGGYRYAPPSADAERTIDLLAESYAKYRVAVISLIFSKPSEGVTRFPEAFRIRRRD
jgi:hypothetical protein